tara:strand:+ start:1194 stop:1529 length:336 start_codon:yes stop_codon:yes gene_type:complete
MITPQHYAVRGLHWIHPEVLDEASMQGRYVKKHFYIALTFMTVVWCVAGYELYVEGDLVQGALMMFWALAVAELYMHIAIQNTPTLPWTPTAGPGATYEDENLADLCEVFL